MIIMLTDIMIVVLTRIIIVVLTERRPGSIIHATRRAKARVSKVNVTGRRKATINRRIELTSRRKRRKLSWRLHVVETTMLSSRTERTRIERPG